MWITNAIKHGKSVQRQYLRRMDEKKKRKDVDLSPQVIRNLQKEADRQKRKLKNYMEYVLIQAANSFQSKENKTN